MSSDQQTARGRVAIVYRNVYGTDHAYPVCSTGRLFLTLTGKSTLRPCDLTTIRSLGYEVAVVAHVPEGVTA